MAFIIVYGYLITILVSDKVKVIALRRQNDFQQSVSYFMFPFLP